MVFFRRQEENSLDTVRPGSPFLAEVSRLELRTKRNLNSTLVGSYRTAFRGKGLIFSDLREYQPGDDIKDVHWKTSARSGRLYVKSYEEERELNVILAIDVSRSIAFGTVRSNFQKALEFSALVTLLGQRLKDSIGLCLFSDGIKSFLRPAHSRFHFHRIISELAAERVLSPKTDIRQSLRSLRETLHRDSLIFLISDFFSPPFEDELLLLSAKHDIVMVVLGDPSLSAFPSVGIIELEDLESGETLTLDSSSPLTSRYLKAVQKRHRARLIKMSRRCKTDIIFIDDNTTRPLINLMRERVARVR